MQRLIVFMLTAALSPSPSFAAAPPPAFVKYECEGGFFRASVPQGWERSGQSAPYADMTTVAGAKFDGPPAAEGASASVALYWYSGERSFRTADSYIRACLNSAVREDADRKDEIARVTVAGRKAKAFHLTTFELVQLSAEDLLAPPKDEKPYVYERRMNARKVIMTEQYIVIPASKGYFVLHYRAPESVFSAYQGLFGTVTALFVPLLP